MIYLDSNVFIYAALNEEEKGNKSRELIKIIRTGGQRAATSSLTFDEFLWKVKKERGFEAALVAGKAFLELSNLVLLDVTITTISVAYEIIKEYKLDPRDAIHAASAIVNGIQTVVSDDPDFDKVKKLKRKSIEEYK